MLQPGTILDNKYEIEAVIGQGGFGYVYRARERLTGETVAIKELVPTFADRPKMVQRFIQEARATLRLSHPHIARTHTIFDDQGTYYLAMEYLPGGSLADKLKVGPLPVEEVLRIASALCDALAYAHREGVVHCDIKPANVLFDERGRVRLADFGIAYVSSELITRQFFTTAGTAMGTVRYMAPEQLEGVRDDARVDIYAVGALLYEMLAGRPYLDFETESTPAAQMRNVQRIQSESPTPLHEVNPRIPQRLARAVEQALDKKPGARPHSVVALRRLLAAEQASTPTVEQRSRPSLPTGRVQPAPEAPPGRVEPTRGGQRSVPRWAVLGLVALISLAALTAITLLVLQALPRSGGRTSGSLPPTTVAPPPSRIPSSPVPSERPTEVPAEEPTQPPSDQVGGGLGTEENPIRWSFVPSGEIERVAAGAEAVADLLHDETGLYFETSAVAEYADVIAALCSDPPKAQMGSLATFYYILANERCGVETELVAVRFGGPTYAGQLITRADSGITGIRDLEGMTFCRPDPLSTTGWTIPSLSMRAEGINPQEDLAEIVDTGSHDAVVAAVYNGECDAGATYVDARGTLQDRHADVMERVVVFHATVDIPNDGVQFVADMDEALKAKIVEGLLAIAETEEGLEALDAAYGWAGLEKHGDEYYDSFRLALQASGTQIEDLLDQ
jgi:phosphate/phosphite/phosphonate ABC transporter binding protein